MSFESPNNNTNAEKEALMVVSGIDKDGTSVYSEIPPSTETFTIKTPDRRPIFAKINTDLDSHVGDNQKLRFGKDEIINIGINSGKKVVYEIVVAKNGHYVLGKLDYETSAPIETIVFELSNSPRIHPNPDLIVCSEQELENWLKM